MQYTFLGNTGVKVSELCMGTMTFGGEADERESKHMFHQCRDAGINFFDCANKYSEGEAEKIMGQCIKNCRDEIVLTTKGSSRMGDGVNDVGGSRKHLMLELEKSLQRLKTDYIDIYFLHYFDPDVSMHSSLRFLDDIVRQGKAIYIGVSNWAAWQIMKALHLSTLNNFQAVDCIQPMYSLIKRQAEVEIFPMAADQQLGVITYSPVGAGVLTGKYSDLDANESARLKDKDYYNKRYRSQYYFDIAERFKDLAEKLGIEPAPLAIAWAKSHPVVTASIIGARNREQLHVNLQASDIEITQELRHEIASLSFSPAPAHDRLEEAIYGNPLAR